MESKFKRHFFVCQTNRPPEEKPSCCQRGSADLLGRLMEALGERPDLWQEVAITATGCLGPCSSGPAMVVYPEGFWYAPVTAEDLPEIISEHLLGGRPVERLRYRW